MHAGWLSIPWRMVSKLGYCNGLVAGTYENNLYSNCRCFRIGLFAWLQDLVLHVVTRRISPTSGSSRARCHAIGQPVLYHARTLLQSANLCWCRSVLGCTDCVLTCLDFGGFHIKVIWSACHLAATSSANARLTKAPGLPLWAGDTCVGEESRSRWCSGCRSLRYSFFKSGLKVNAWSLA